MKMNTIVPIVNQTLVDKLVIDYVKLYAPTTSWGNIVSMNLGYPGLRAYWTMSSVDENEDIYDISGQGRTLTNNP